MPGTAVLEFELTPLDKQRNRVSTVAYFQPSGVFGTLYWNALLPIHDVVFKGLTQSIVERARGGPKKSMIVRTWNAFKYGRGLDW